MRTAALLLAAASLLAAGTVTRSLRFSISDLTITTTDNGCLFEIEEAELLDRAGAPALPCLALSVELPAGTRAAGVRVAAVEFETIPGEHTPVPAHPPAILSARRPPRRAGPEPAVYASTVPYPQELCRLTGQGLERGVPVASVVVCPVQYMPAERRLRLAACMDIEVDYATSTLLDEPPGDSGAFDYLIVTGPGLDTVFARLADWKAARGLRAAVRMMDWVRANQSGRDDAEKLRNYLKACERDSGLKWLLLGGDVDVVPVRMAFAMACSAGLHPREDSLPCDLYYSDLDGTWDEDGDGGFGEVADSIDLHPDIYVGRAPVNSAAEARAFVNKLLMYEDPLSSDYLRRALFAALVLWEDPYTDEGIAKDWIDEQSFPSWFDPIHKLYHRNGYVSHDSVVAELNLGPGLFNHCGHGWTDVMGLSGFDKLRNVDMDCLNNNGRFGIGYSIGCWTTAFDLDAIAEHYVRNPQGGGVAFIGNSSYGWGAPGNPRFGYSDRFDARFFQELFNSPEPRVGEVLARAKRHFIPYSRESNVYRWHQYCLNLMGDPEMPVHTDTLSHISASLPSSLPVGRTGARVVALDESGPIAGAAVVIRKGGETWTHARTGRDGSALLEPTCASAGLAEVIITAPNYRPLVESVSVVSGAHVALAGWQVDDSLGNGDGKPGPGESLLLRVTVRNSGTARTAALSARITTRADFISVPSDSAALPALDTGWTAGLAFPVSISPDASNGQVALCTLTVRDSLGAWWDDPIALQVAEPGIEVIATNHSYHWYDPRPGDTLSVDVLVRNTGLAPVRGITGCMFQADPNLVPIVPALLFPDIAPGDTAWSLNSCQVEVSPHCEFPIVAKLGVNLSAPGIRVGDTLRILLGALGLRGDTIRFTHGGTPDLWHLEDDTGLVYHAGTDSGPYPSNCNSWLLSPAFVMPEQAELRFRRKFDVPTYGADGLYVIVCNSSAEDTLDFIGSGGALKTSRIADCRLSIDGQDGIASEWFEEAYDLSSFEPGESAHVKLSFVSDGDVAAGDGFLVDAVTVENSGPNASWEERLVDSSRLVTAFPSPFRRSTTIVYSVAPWRARRLTLTVYDGAGRVVKAIVTSVYAGPTRHFAVSWNGDDDAGRLVPAGVYFVQLRAVLTVGPNLHHRTSDRPLRLVLVR